LFSRNNETLVDITFSGEPRKFICFVIAYFYLNSSLFFSLLTGYGK